MAVGQTHFLVLGPYGSGLTTALNAFGEFGYLTVSGVEPDQVHNTIAPLLSGASPVAFALRLTPDTDASAVLSALHTLKENLPSLKVLTLDAPEGDLIQRYVRAEKPHPFESLGLQGVEASVRQDKALNTPLKALKDYSIDTSTTTGSELRLKVAKILGRPMDNTSFTVQITTFGFKYGAPQDAELMFDMRFMTNPFYDEALRPLNGRDKPVRDFIFNLPEAEPFFKQWSALICSMLPLYQAQGKTRLSIAVGCTGGKHRSVCMAEALATHLKEYCPAYQVVMTHREMLKWGHASDAAATPSTSCQ